MSGEEKYKGGDVRRGGKCHARKREGARWQINTGLSHFLKIPERSYKQNGGDNKQSIPQCRIRLRHEQLPMHCCAVHGCWISTAHYCNPTSSAQAPKGTAIL